jgi:hypothetical protein
MARGFSLHIGLNKVDPKAYPPKSVPTLKAAETDARCWRNVATYYFQQINELIGKAATSAAVIEHVTAAAAELQAGDMFLLTYSGHGGQVPDDNGDERDDELDETWVLYDRELLDDELYSLLAQFVPRVRVLVISDSCHSGTMIRGRIERYLAADDQEQGRNRTAPPVFRGLTAEQSATVFEANRAEYQAIQQRHRSGDRAPIQASVLLMSGCQDNQQSLDGDENGLFTETMLLTWDQGRYKGGLRRFFRSVLAEMPSYQTPNLLRLGPADKDFEALRPFKVSPDQKDPLT